MGLISRVSSRTYRKLDCSFAKTTSVTFEQNSKCLNSLAPTPLSSSKTKVSKSPPITSKKSSKLLAFQLTHSGQVSLPQLLALATSVNSSPTSDPVWVQVVLPLLLKKKPKKRKKNPKLSPTPTWVLISLDNHESC